MAATHYYENHPYTTATHRPSYPEAPYPPTAGGALVSGNSRPQDGSEDSYIEEINREFPPGAYTYRPHPAYPPPPSLVYNRYKDRRRTMGDMYDDYGPPRHGVHRRLRDGDYYYTRDEDFRRMKRDRSRRNRRDYHSDDSSPSRSPSPRRRRRRKSLSDQAVGALGGAAAALGLKSRSRSRDRYDDRNYHSSRGRHRRGHGSSRSRSRSRSRSGSRSRGHRSGSRNEIARSLTAALTAGAAEAYRARKEPGGWNGDKGKRILTAALGAGGVGGMLEHSGNDKHNKRHLIESTLAGLAANHLVNGPRSKSRGRGGRRARSESQGGFKDLASAGLLAAAGKKAYNHHRSKSRDRRGRSPDYSSDEEGNRPRRRGVSRKRSHSVSAYLSKGLSALGLTEDDDRRGHRSSRRYDSPSDDESDDYYDARRPSRRRRHRRRDYSRDRYDGNYRDFR